MKAYFVKTNGNNFVMYVNDDGEGKIFECVPDGKFMGVDLYAPDAAEKLKITLEKLGVYASDFDEMIGGDFPADEVEKVIESQDGYEAELVWESK